MYLKEKKLEDFEGREAVNCIALKTTTLLRPSGKINFLIVQNPKI